MDLETAALCCMPLLTLCCCNECWHHFWAWFYLLQDYMGRCILTLTRVILEGEYKDCFQLDEAKSGRLNLHLKWSPQHIYRDSWVNLSSSRPQTANLLKEAFSSTHPIDAYREHYSHSCVQVNKSRAMYMRGNTFSVNNFLLWSKGKGIEQVYQTGRLVERTVGSAVPWDCMIVTGQATSWMFLGNDANSHDWSYSTVFFKKTSNIPLFLTVSGT
jgi:hypothetical protein